MSKPRILIYLVRRDLRVSDNPILNYLAETPEHGFTHLLPVFVFPAQQIEVSGFIKDGSSSPYPEARSAVAGYWRCGPHRAKFIGESVWNLKESLEGLGSGLVLRAGLMGDVLASLLEGLGSSPQEVGAVWMISEEGVEERRDQRAVSSVCKKFGVDLKLWIDEKYFVDDRDLTIDSAADLPDVFTTYRKQTEPLRKKPRATAPKPAKSSLPSLPDESIIPPQSAPFTSPTTYEELESALLKPVKDYLPGIPSFPSQASSSDLLKGGEDSARDRLEYLIKSEVMFNYKDTRNGLLGTDYSTRLSGFLAHGCITARQVHEALVKYEDGTDPAYENVKGYGQGENEGTTAVRIELLWRDYMRLCMRKFKQMLFHLEGFRADDQYKESEKKTKWKSRNEKDALPDQDPTPREIGDIIDRFNAGTTGMGLIDASQRELMQTGYTSNRARQNVASFLAKHLAIDWRYGAEWYEMLLVDYDVSSNWANWQYVSGVGNDPRGEARIFNPVKQAFEYDKEGAYVKAWVPETRDLEKLENVFQLWTTSEEELEKLGLKDNPMVTDPVKKIQFSVDRKPNNSRRPFNRRRGAPRRPANSEGATQAQQSQAQEQQSSQAAQAVQLPDRTNYFQNNGGYRGGPRGGHGGGYRGRANPGGNRGGGAGYRGRYYPGSHAPAWNPPGPPM
ncbi:Cryptochrome DASH [Pleurostoma richardsiae]|uniref:Cryptochrome DASH n=1 Tax=Pleurostoma richardsiae TaxID=41990 RepID=A0AA38RP05_9PEZI|nr:Cryptochrome DASH [Pleurostoma richardsiae]